MSSSPPMDAQTVVAALNVLHGEMSTNESRRQAQQYVEQVKAQPQTCLAISLAILHMDPSSIPPNQLATARHFALHALQHLIAANWNQSSDDEACRMRAYIKEQAIGIAENVSRKTSRRRNDVAAMMSSDRFALVFDLSLPSLRPVRCPAELAS
jgi:hypothetical protein